MRPSRDTWRWRPRHRICQPPSRNQSIPAQRTTARARPSCDRLRGSLRSGDMSPREGRAPARPLPPCRFRSSGSSTLPRRPAVAENCDPPATRGDGALAIVSANRLPEISPFPRNARRRGRRRHGKSSNARMAKRNRKSKIMNRNYQLPTTNCQLKKAKGDAPRASPPDTGGASTTHTLVEVAGFEPATSCLQSRRSTS